jgi:hypothetical protein
LLPEVTVPPLLHHTMSLISLHAKRTGPSAPMPQSLILLLPLQFCTTADLHSERY